MKALLLSAGLGTRLRPLTNNTPKCLIKINGRPLLDYWIEKLFKLELSQIIINTHYLSEQVETFVNDSKYKKFINLSYEKKLLGTAGTLVKHYKFFDGEDGFLIHADNFCIDDLNEMITTHQHRPPNCVMTMLIFETDKPKESGIVSIDKNNVVQEFYEKVSKPPSNLANGAIYILSSAFFREVEKFDLSKITDFSKQVIPRFLGKIVAYKTNKLFKDIGSIETYNFVNEYLRRNKK